VIAVCQHFLRKPLYFPFVSLEFNARPAIPRAFMKPQGIFPGRFPFFVMAFQMEAKPSSFKRLVFLPKSEDLLTLRLIFLLTVFRDDRGPSLVRNLPLETPLKGCRTLPLAALFPAHLNLSPQTVGLPPFFFCGKSLGIVKQTDSTRTQLRVLGTPLPWPLLHLVFLRLQDVLP